MLTSLNPAHNPTSNPNPMHTQPQLRPARAGSGKWQDGAVPASVIKAQIAVMNAALAPTPFSVRTAGIDTTINASVSLAKSARRHLTA